MSISRRDVLKLGASSATALFLPTTLLAAFESMAVTSRKTLSIVQGATDETKTQFSIVHLQELSLRIEVWMGGSRIDPDEVNTYSFEGQRTSVTQAFFSSLRSGMDLNLIIKNDSGKILDQRIFQTLASQGDLSFGILSCMHDAQHRADIWHDIASKKPNVLFFIGDSTYADSEVRANEARPETLWRRFAEARETLEIYHLPRLIPIIAVWDDHDFGLNNSNSENYPYIKESQKNFLTYFPMNPKYCSYLQRGPGVSTCFSFREQQIVLLDDRSFRLPSGSKDPHAHWGASQEEWCIQKVREQRGTTWLMNGSQFFPHVMWKESVAGDHPEQLKGFVKNIQNTGRKVIFASGDVHYSEISRIEREILGFETYEITSSSIHSKSVPGFPHLVPNPRRVASVGKRNYILVDCNIGGNSNRFKVTSFSPGRTNFQLQIGG